VGTWKHTSTYDHTTYTSTDITQLTLNADGTFIQLRDKVNSNDPDTHDYGALKGTYSVDAEGNITISETYYADNLSSFSIEGADWTPYDHPNEYKGPVLVIGNQLYTQAFLIAQGLVSGIVGTWGVEGMNKMWDSDANAYDQTYFKYELVFMNDGTVTRNRYESSTGTFGLPESSTGTYSYSNGTFTMQIDSETYTNKVTIYNNKYLIFGDETSATANAFIKQ